MNQSNKTRWQVRFAAAFIFILGFAAAGLDLDETYYYSDWEYGNSMPGMPIPPPQAL